MVADELWLGRGVTAGAGFATEYVRLDPDDGSPLGTVTEDGFATVPAVTGTILADVSVLGFPPEAPWRLTVRDAATTEVLWTAALPAGAAEPFTAGARGPVVAHGHVYVATDEGLLAFDAAGCGAPTCDPAWTAPHRADLWGDLALGAATGDGHVTVTRRYSGVEGSTGAAFTRASLTAYTSTGAVGWTVPPVEAGSNEVLATAVAGDVFYVAGREEGDGPEPARHHLRAYGTGTGAPLWSADLGASGPATRAGIAVGGDVVYVGVDGAIRAFARDGCGAAACPPLAELPVPGTPGALAVAGGHLLVMSGPAGTPASTLTAFAPPDPR
jgi:hypothetical protein